MPIKQHRMRALQSRYGKKKGRRVYHAMEKHPRAYQVMVKEGRQAPRPLRGMRLFDTKREGAQALKDLAPYGDHLMRFTLRPVRK